MALTQKEAEKTAKILISHIFELLPQEGTEADVRVLKAELNTILSKFD